MSNLFTGIRFFMALLTVLAIGAKPLIPPKVLVLHPSETTEKGLYGPPHPQGQPRATWLDETANAMRCEYPIHRGSIPCGFSVKWGNPPRQRGCFQPNSFARCANAFSDPERDGWGWENGKTCVVIEETGYAATGHPMCSSAASDPDGDGWGWEHEKSCIVISGATDNSNAPVCKTVRSDPDGDGWSSENGRNCRVPGTGPCAVEPESFASVDASGYDGLTVQIHYEGRSPYIRLNLINSDPALLALGKDPKPMSTFLSTEDLRAGPVFVNLREFSVEEWWTIKANPPREFAGPDFSDITQVSVDIDDHGVHRMRVDEIKLIGERIDTETYLLTMVILWAGFLLLEGGIRYYRLRTACQNEREQLEDLAGGARQLEAEKAQLKNRARTDPLTGALNRNGLAQRLGQQYGMPQLPAGVGLMMFDIDHFKALNDAHGHAAGDAVLRDISALMISTTRAEDIFVRWGGEEFLLIVDQVSREKLVTIAEKLRQRVSSHPFKFDRQLEVTVSIGVAQSRAGEDFDTLFRRADKALYEAKKTRNTVKYASREH